MSLIDYWKLDQSSGTTVASIGSNANNLTLQSGTWLPSGGYSNGCISLDGSTQYLFSWDNDLSGFPCQDDGSGPSTFSIAAWVYITDMGSPGKQNPLISKTSARDGTPYNGFQFNATNNSNGLFPEFIVWRNDSTSTTVTGNTALLDNTWQHIAATYQYIGNGTSKIRVFLNGSLVGSSNSAVGPAQDNPQRLYIGGYNYSPSGPFKWFEGRIDEVRVYDHALSSTEVSNLYSPTTGEQPITHWKFDDSAGTVTDSEGINDLTISGSYGWLDSPDSIKDGCLYLGGTNQYAYRSDDTLSNIPGQFDGTGPTTFSISLWFYIDENLNSSKRYPLLNKYGLKVTKDGNSWDGGWALFASNATSSFRPQFWTYSGSVTSGPYSTVITSNTSISARTWHHLVAQFEGSGAYNSQTSVMTLWLDGVQVASTSTAWGPVAESPQPLELGRYKNNRLGNEEYTRGRFDETKLFNYWLSPAEIADLQSVATITLLGGHALSAQQGELQIIHSGYVYLDGLTASATLNAAEAGIYRIVDLSGQELNTQLQPIGVSADSDLINWLAENKGDRAVLVEATYHDGTTTNTAYISNIGYITDSGDTPSNTAYVDILSGVPEIFEGIKETSIGSIIVENSEGSLDYWLTDYVFSGWPLTVYIGNPEWDRWQFREIISGIIDNVSAPNSHQIEFTLTNKAVVFDTPVQTQYMGGDLSDDNVLVPISLGYVHAVPAVLVSESTHRYKVHESAIQQIDDIDAGGATVAWTSYLSDGEFTVGQDWQERKITAILLGETNGTAAAMVEWFALRAGLTAGEIDFSNFSSFPNTAPMGIWIENDKSIAEAINDVLSSVGAFYRFTPRGLLQIKRLDLPEAGGYVLTDDDIVENGIELISVDPPRLTTQLGYFRTWGVLQWNELYFNLSEKTRARFTLEFRRVSSTNAGITTKWPQAKTTELIPTLLYDKADAQVEANRRRDLRAAPLYTFRIIAYGVPFEYSIGDSINITFPRYGFNDGRDMRILSIRQKPTENIVEMEVWGP